MLAARVSAGDRFRESHPVVLVDHDDFAMRNDPTVYEHIERIARGAVQLDNRAYI